MNELTSIISSNLNSDNLQTDIKTWINTKDIGFGKVMQPLRLALVGDLKGPDLFQIIDMIGKAETIRRIEIAIDTLQT